MLTLALPLVLVLAPPQDLVVRGVTVHTGTVRAWEGPVVAADGRLQPPGTKVPGGAHEVALGGAFLYPGLTDAHAHLKGFGASLENVDLVGTTSYSEVIERVLARAATTLPGEWITGRGWDQNDWTVTDMPHHRLLSEAVPDHPVYLTRIDGHAGLANATAMKLAGVREGTESPSGGELLWGETGLPTGVFVDRAQALVRRVMPGAGPDQVRRQLLAAQRECLAAGLTCVHDAGMGPETVDILRALHTAGRWHLRVYVMLPGGATEAIRRGPWMTPDQVITVRAVKGYADGALGSYGALLLEPYSDRKNFKGLATNPMKGLLKLSQLCADHGFQLCVHAIGDKANREVLDAYEATVFKNGRAAARFRVEHAQVIAPEDFKRFLDLHVIPSMQPTHLTSDMPWAPERLGAERISGTYAWRTFHRLGLPVAFGSDFPVESHDPRKGLFAAVTTRSETGGPEAGWRPDQKLSRAEAIRGFTLDAAYAAFQEHDLGTVEPGKFADFTVFDRDLSACKENELLEAKVLLTVIRGRVVYRAED